MTGAQRGVTTVTDRVTARIARQAAAEATAPLGGRAVRGAASRTGRSVEVTVEVELPLRAPADVGGMTRLRGHVADRTRYLTGQTVASADVRIRALGIAPPHPQPPPGDAPAVPEAVRRPWSRRRRAVVLPALVLTALSGLLLWSALSSRLPGATAPARAQVEQAEQDGRRERVLRDVGGLSVVRHGAVPAAALAGGWLILLALTPGDRRALALGCAPPVRARTTRASAARLVRGALGSVPGLRVHGVRFTRRRVTVRAEAAFGSPEALRRTATDVVGATVASLPLGRRPTVRLVLRETPNRRAGRETDARQDGTDTGA
ncbi:hypothetical protein GCM10010363_39310 [Streptomyces omiyaensis]|uniref:DUF6286 domain-containing protein n=1 Tax=Streptomyces omiyaensis TaxID=68247 RepID=UPI0016744A69|nr:DUF6286 domain-containing protein [Streptomyces omiyaensis]GGY54302.1 hypothetical protein GCM10010363_39310 [Streptomyces omiyaensis]